ncbi:MAG: hypothetical protein JXB49_21450 [Bacteroidales bacterium]|nr:hypothetical protein [Bacteroidales bacterium]
MKENLHKKTWLGFFLAALSFGLCAQTDFTLDPSTLTPADSGYYLYGVPADIDGNDIIEEGEWASGCPNPDDFWGDDDFWETGLQQGFFYEKTMIMPTCSTKNEPAPGVPLGYIMLKKNLYAGTDSAQGGGYIVSSPIKNLESIKVIISPDVTPKTATRPVTLWIEYSKDSITWDDDNFIEVGCAEDNKSGDIFQIEAGDPAYTAIDTMIKASQEGSIVLRVTANLAQRVKVHQWIITADTGTFVSNKEIKTNSVSQLFTIKDNIILSNSGQIEVYNILGQFIGKGTSVAVERHNIYIVRNQRGYAHKVYIR